MAALPPALPAEAAAGGVTTAAAAQGQGELGGVDAGVRWGPGSCQLHVNKVRSRASMSMCIPFTKCVCVSPSSTAGRRVRACISDFAMHCARTSLARLPATGA